jgi:hypothetical protein
MDPQKVQVPPNLDLNRRRLSSRLGLKKNPLINIESPTNEMNKKASLTPNNFENHHLISKRKNSIFSQFKSKLKEGLKTRENQFSNLEEECESVEESEKKQTEVLKQAYYSLLCAALDPVSYVHESHNFQLKTFTKLTTCDECKSVLWGISIRLF